MPNAAPEQEQNQQVTGASADADRAASPAGLSPEGGSSQVASHGARFTPGPWDTAEGDSVIRICAAGLPIAATDTKSYYVRFDETDRANARLIAAAPDLLAALEDCVAVAATPLKRALAISDKYDSAFDKAMQALAKARGQ